MAASMSSQDPPAINAASRLVFPRIYDLQIDTNVDELGLHKNHRGHYEDEEVVALTGMPERAVKARKYYRLAYLSLVAALCAAALTTPRIYLRDAAGLLRRDALGPLVALLIFAAATFFAVQGSNPGFISLEHVREGSRADGLRRDGDENTGGEASLRSIELSGVSGAEASPADAGLLSPSAEASNDSDSDTSSEGFVLDVEPDEALDEALGHVQRSRVPMRAKYCRNSQRYVATYDHYCGVLGTCIGEKNHCRFWWFLLAHMVGLAYLTRLVQSGFQDTKAEVGTWLDHNTHALVVFLVVVLLLFAVCSLLLFHSFLACAAMTSYEFLRADRISYLDGTRDFDLPFSRGLCTNLHRFCILDGARLLCVAHEHWQPRRWARALIDRESEDVWNNLWENRYWSCC